MIAVWAILLMMFVHWLADFVWQPDWMGTGKSESWPILTQHSLRITASAYVTAAVVAVTQHQHIIWPVLAYTLINGAGHFLIDAVTSRMTSKLYAKGDFHRFFIVIGFDQFLHMAIAVSTLAWLVYV